MLLKPASRGKTCKLLAICTGNAARAILAEGRLNQLTTKLDLE